MAFKDLEIHDRYCTSKRDQETALWSGTSQLYIKTYTHVVSEIVFRRLVTGKWNRLFRNCFFFRAVLHDTFKNISLRQEMVVVFSLFFYVCQLTFLSSNNFTREVEIQVGEFCAGGHHHPRARQAAILVVTLIRPLPFYSTKISVPLSRFILSF